VSEALHIATRDGVQLAAVHDGPDLEDRLVSVRVVLPREGDHQIVQHSKWLAFVSNAIRA
jgi:hypothetical protein